MKKILIFISFFFMLIGLSAVPFAIAQTTQTSTYDQWVADPEVTFVGKNAARAGQLFDWTMQHYPWLCVSQTNVGCANNSNNPLFALTYLYVAPLAVLICLIILIRIRKKPFSWGQFLMRFGICTVVILSASVVVLGMYQTADFLQGEFLRTDPKKLCPPKCLSQADLLFVGWSPEAFIGLSVQGNANTESAWTSLLLTKLTALVYFVMTGALLLRKTVLWVFIIVSPLLALFILFKPVQNLGKLIVAEFLVWLLYAPLLTLMLAIVSYVWKLGLTSFHPPVDAGSRFFPTSVNILLGGPGQMVTPTNNINVPETFLLYVVSLMTLMVVIVLPWVILRIVVDYAVSSHRSTPKEQLP